MVAPIQWDQKFGGSKAWDMESGSFAFNGTNTECTIPTGLSELYHATFMNYPGTSSGDTGGIMNYRILEAALTTTTGIVTVTGTALTVGRLVEHGGTYASQNMTYQFWGKS